MKRLFCAVMIAAFLVGCAPAARPEGAGSEPSESSVAETSAAPGESSGGPGAETSADRSSAVTSSREGTSSRTSSAVRPSSKPAGQAASQTPSSDFYENLPFFLQGESETYRALRDPSVRTSVRYLSLENGRISLRADLPESVETVKTDHSRYD